MEDRFWGFHLDFMGFVASFLCAIHCAAIPFLLSVSFLGGLTWISEPAVEMGFLLASVTIGGFTLALGYKRNTIDKVSLILFSLGFILLLLSRVLPHNHGTELIIAILGGLIVASAHIYHWNSSRRSCQSIPRS